MTPAEALQGGGDRAADAHAHERGRHEEPRVRGRGEKEPRRAHELRGEAEAGLGGPARRAGSDSERRDLAAGGGTNEFNGVFIPKFETEFRNFV